MADNLRITTVQSALDWEDIEANLAMFTKKLSNLVGLTDVVVLPEMFTTWFSMDAPRLAEPMNGRTMNWLASQASLQPPPELDATDGFGNRYFTLGAGLPVGSDTGLHCGGGNLTKGINRDGDVTKPVKALRKLPVAHVSEGATIFSLLIHFNSYANNVPYWCTPGDPDSTTGLAYNSNSFAHGLLHAAGVPHKEREPKWPAPGWSLPLPAKYFRPR